MSLISISWLILVSIAVISGVIIAVAAGWTDILIIIAAVGGKNIFLVLVCVWVPIRKILLIFMHILIECWNSIGVIQPIIHLRFQNLHFSIFYLTDRIHIGFWAIGVCFNIFFAVSSFL